MFVTILLIVIIIFFIVLGMRSSRPRPERFITELKELNAIRVSVDEKNLCSERKYKIIARLDFIFKTPSDEHIVIEFKSRRGGIYQGDIDQLKATAIAVRNHYDKVNIGYVYNSGGEVKKIKLMNNSVLYSDIEDKVTTAHVINSGTQPHFNPVEKKCRACSYNQVCYKSALK